MRFMSKHTTRSVCRDMIAALKERKDGVDFETVFGVAVASDPEKLQTSGVLLGDSGYFSIKIVKPDSSSLVSGFLQLNEQDEDPLKELGFLLWLSKLFTIKPRVAKHEHIKLIDNKGGAGTKRPESGFYIQRGVQSLQKRRTQGVCHEGWTFYRPEAAGRISLFATATARPGGERGQHP